MVYILLYTCVMKRICSLLLGAHMGCLLPKQMNWLQCGKFFGNFFLTFSLIFFLMLYDYLFILSKLYFYFRENTSYWKVKDIDPKEQRNKGYCPLTPKEVGIFLSALGYPANTPIYIASGEIYGGDSQMAELKSRFPLLMSKV